MLKKSVTPQPRPVAGTACRLPVPRGCGRVDRHPPARRGELDLLRALVVVGLVFFHTAVIFGAGEFPLKAATENQGGDGVPRLRRHLGYALAVPHLGDGRLLLAAIA
jgi:hypothetical protein